MKRAYLTVRADFVASLAHLALNPSQFSALALIVANPGVSQSALARALSVERSAVVALIDNLQNRAFVSRDPVPGDRRSYALRATLAGIRQWEKAIETIRVHEQRAFARLSDSERATLVELLSRVEG
jgi:DNA-binding MarR family transcriptional regulator